MTYQNLFITIYLNSMTERVSKDAHQRAETEWKFSGNVLREAHSVEFCLNKSRMERISAIKKRGIMILS